MLMLPALQLDLDSPARRAASVREDLELKLILNSSQSEAFPAEAVTDPQQPNTARLLSPES